MSDQFEFSDFADLDASFQAAREAIKGLCYFHTDLDNLIGQFDLPAKAKSAAAEHNTFDPCELGSFLVRQAPHVVAGFLAHYQVVLPDCVNAVETHVNPLMNEFASVRALEFQMGSIKKYRSAATALYRTIREIHYYVSCGRRNMPQLLTTHVPEWREVLRESECPYLRFFVQKYYRAEAFQPDSVMSRARQPRLS
jgi:hypothetical protein